ncbi:NADH dehydrogenase, partial [Linderina pennispora]
MATTFAQRQAMSTLNKQAKPRTSRLRQIKRAVYAVGLGTAGFMGWSMYTTRNPSDQMPFDPSKKTLVLLGTGWGSTTLLKNLDTTNFNVVVVSPRNYFLFTPLLPSCTVGTIENRSIMEPVRLLTRHKEREVKFLEAACVDIDVDAKQLVLERHTNSDAILTGKGKVDEEPFKLNYDYLVVGVGGTVNTFGTPGVEEHACFLKEMADARQIRRRLMDTVEKASFDDVTEAERDRLLHMVVVGGGPTGIEYAGELHDFMEDDLSKWYPELVDRVRITLVEAMPNVLPAFDKKLITFTQDTFKENNISILTRTMVKEVKEKTFIVQNPDGTRSEIPYGLLVWATGIKAQPITNKIRQKFPEVQTNGRGLLVDEYLRVKGAKDIWALGDCAVSSYAPLAQVASQQGKWLARKFNHLSNDDLITDLFLQMNAKTRPFKYSSQGSLAYIGSEKAIADLPFFNRNITAGGVATFWFWKSAYLSELLSLRNRTRVAIDWASRWMYGRDLSRE